MHDAVQPFLIDNADIRGAHVRLGQAWREVIARSDAPAPLQPLLGEAIAATGLLTAGPTAWSGWWRSRRSARASRSSRTCR